MAHEQGSGTTIGMTRNMMAGGPHLPETVRGNTLKASAYVSDRMPSSALDGRASLGTWKNTSRVASNRFMGEAASPMEPRDRNGKLENLSGHRQRSRIWGSAPEGDTKGQLSLHTSHHGEEMGDDNDSASHYSIE